MSVATTDQQTNTNGGDSKGYAYCISCKINHQDGKKHIYKAWHQKTLLELLQKEAQKIEGIKSLMKSAAKVDGSHKGEPYHCFTCQLDISTEGEKFMGFEAAKHLSKNKHQNTLETFWGQTGAFLLKDRLKKTKQKFIIGANDYREYLKNVKKNDWSDGEPLRKPPTEDQPISSMQLIKIQLGDDLHEASRDPAAVIEPTPRDSSNYPTKTNDKGIMQNPTGYHEGERVWGGGIIKVKNWLPWPIDVDPDADSVVQQQNTWNNQPQQTQTQPVPQQAIPQLPTSRPVRTVTAVAQGLTSIAPMELAPGEGNVHTGAPPPWLLDAQGKLKDNVVFSNGTIRRLNQADGRRRKAQPKKPQKLGSDLVRTPGVVVANADFLPNFSSLWRAQTGSRLESAQEFRQEQRDLLQQTSGFPALQEDDNDEPATIAIYTPAKMFQQNVSQTQIKKLVM